MAWRGWWTSGIVLDSWRTKGLKGCKLLRNILRCVGFFITFYLAWLFFVVPVFMLSILFSTKHLFKEMITEEESLRHRIKTNIVMAQKELETLSLELAVEPYKVGFL